eukprot:6719745-Karenia_brevis.AAC.1
MSSISACSLAVFPCKDTSKLKHQRRSLHGAQSSLLQYWLFILETRKRFCSAPVFFLLENTFIDLAPMRAVSKELGALPFRINADKCCLFSRDRLYWYNFPLLATDAEVIREGPDYVTIVLAKDPYRWDVLEP